MLVCKLGFFYRNCDPRKVDLLVNLSFMRDDRSKNPPASVHQMKICDLRIILSHFAAITLGQTRPLQIGCGRLTKSQNVVVFATSSIDRKKWGGKNGMLRPNLIKNGYLFKTITYGLILF